jgi:P4 family phage/plasmid primase-like protien
MFWDGKTWRRDWNASIVRNLAGNLIESIYREGSDFINDGAAFASWARTSAKQTTINNAINLASDFPDIQLPEMAIDGDCMVCGFNKAKNVINLKSGEIRDAEMGDYVTRSIGVSEIGDANKALRWMRFLDEVFNGDAELIDWIKRFFGYCMTGRMDEQFFVFLYGFGANGKSVFVEILSRLSAEYSRNIQPETLMMQSKTGSGASPDIARLAGARVVTANETESGKSLAESLIKQIVGGDTMTARENYGQPFEFRPVCKLVFAGNHKPVIRSVDNGIWRRVRMIPFARVFSPGERDPKLIDKLIHELPHIAAWAIDGCLEWQRRGLHDIPAAIAGSTSEYREEMDILGRWIEERTHSSPNHILTTAKAYTDYREWALGYGYNAITEAAFGRQLSERGIEKGRTSKARHYKGIDLIDRPYCV